MVQKDYSEIVSLYLVIEKCLIILCKDKMIITEEIFNKLEAQYSEKKLVFLPRIILDSATPESVKESLREAGIRIMNE